MLVKSIENISGFDDATQAVILSYDDAAIETVVDSIARLYHRAIARTGGVVKNKWMTLARCATGLNGLRSLRGLSFDRLRNQQRHLVGVLFTLQNVMTYSPAGTQESAFSSVWQTRLLLIISWSWVYSPFVWVLVITIFILLAFNI